MSLPVRKGLYQALVGSTAVKALVNERIYHEQAPESAVFPYLIFSKQAGTKIRVLKTGKQIKQDVWLVKAVDRNTSSNRADEIAEAVDTLLDESTFTVTGKTVIDLHHRGDVEYVENDGDQQYRHSGANYGVVLS